MGSRPQPNRTIQTPTAAMTHMLTLLDWILILAVTAQCLGIAYLRHPGAKALMLAIPIPVTFGILALGRPIDVTNAAGLLLSMGFTLTVLLLHKALRVRILLAIALAALAYCGCGVLLAAWLPKTAPAFWATIAAAVAVAACAIRAMPPRDEPLHRSPLPIAAKAAIVFGVVLGLVLIKHRLQGFMTTFPMLGVIASYETRRSLYTTSRIIPVSCLAFAATFAICRLLQDSIGVYTALLPGLLAYAGLVFIFRKEELREAVMSEAGSRKQEPRIERREA